MGGIKFISHLITYIAPHSYLEINMARVGKKKFPYTKTGMKAAKKYAKKTGKKMTSAKRKKY